MEAVLTRKHTTGFFHVDLITKFCCHTTWKKASSKDERGQGLEVINLYMCPILCLHPLFSPAILRGTIAKGAHCLSEHIQLGWSAATSPGIACSDTYHSGNLSPEHQITHSKCCKVMVSSGSWEDHSDLLWLVPHILPLQLAHHSPLTAGSADSWDSTGQETLCLLNKTSGH